MKFAHAFAGALFWALSTTMAMSQPAAAVRVDGAWARAAVAGQSGTGAFMALTARQNLKLVGAQSPAAGIAEVHEMKLDGDVMRMRPVTALELPAGKTVQFKPGGYHLMLLDLKAPLAEGAVVPVTLVFRDDKGGESRLALQLPVTARAPAPMDGHKH